MTDSHIMVGGIPLKAAICPHGCRGYPVSSLALHIMSHERLEAGIVGTHGWNENRPGKTHVGNKHGRPKKKPSEKANTASIKMSGKGRYR